LFAEAESSGEKNGVPGRPVSPMPTAPLPNGASWQSCRRLIFVPRSAQKGYTVGHWPIPESFWPDINSDALVSSDEPFYLFVFLILDDSRDATNFIKPFFCATTRNVIV